MKRIIIIGFLMVFGFYASFSQTTDEQIMQAANTLGVPYADLRQFVQSYQNNTSADVIVVDIDTFLQAYESNPIRADNQYKGKTIRITGVVSQVTTDAVYLKASNKIRSAKISFRSIELQKIANLEVGQTVTFIGIGNGGIGGTGSFPEVKDAVLVFD